MKPTIIMVQTIVAAAARRVGSTCLASSTSSDVPAEPVPTPISMKEAIASSTPPETLVLIQAVLSAAPMPPSASAPMPPMIHGVRRPPTSEPWPKRGRSNCTA